MNESTLNNPKTCLLEVLHVYMRGNCPSYYKEKKSVENVPEICGNNSSFD